MKKMFAILFFVALTLGMVSTKVGAVPFNGVEFPDGEVSFADAVISYEPDYDPEHSATPFEKASIPSNALGTPNFGMVSLGDGGRITLQFTDNSLTGSGDGSFDLWVYEVGPDVEDTYVEISKDNITWYSVGKVFGSTSGIDIDAFGFGTDDFFSYVRLTDDTNEGGQIGDVVGADIAAVGAISSAPPVANPTPEPGTFFLLSVGLLGLLKVRRMLTI
ncbi:hypothetical protein DENIS_0449 [Desulfonema ishimotonii]|uniref:Ice-binding protein C-terminal domain-containing protein n=1 Tax=Desulfonema ishimotonii TaxID=45657 RepID=A0A401FRC3_9BACT|nr:PEP-CTERM sorting domain-containing protein [Desulfonema ishimotonii]GBC59510.1 hypothetical protein DENIS_0449 [Desulfonema ishimotonii]